MRYATASLATLIALSTALSPSLRAQAVAPENLGQTPVFAASLGYTYLHANVPPAQCGCFSANGGYGSATYYIPHGYSIVADIAAVHASNIAGTKQTVTIVHYLFGPRYTLRSFKRFVPYVQALGGLAHETSNYAAVQSVNGAAFSVGGGVTTPLSTHLSWTVVEADWVESRLPNGQNNIQNDLRLSTAITFRLGSR